MDKINIKFKKHHADAVMPKQAHDTDAGYDLVAVDDGNPVWETNLERGVKYLSYFEYNTGISVQPPKGYHIEIYPRSSVTKMALVLGNSIGLIDNSYTGLIKFRFKPMLTVTQDGGTIFGPIYKKGDKIGQMVIKKTEYATFEEVSELDETKRGEGGFGSTDTKIL